MHVLHFPESCLESVKSKRGQPAGVRPPLGRAYTVSVVWLLIGQKCLLL